MVAAGVYDEPLQLHDGVSIYGGYSQDFKLRDHPTDRGIDWKSLPTLPELLVGKVKGRESENQITGFVNNIGMGAQLGF